MDEPIYDVTTERVYARLPEHFRRSDINQDYVLKKIIQAIGAEQNKITELIERFDYTPPEDGGAPGDTSELVDPRYANSEWLPWLAQLLGVRLNSKIIDSSTRFEIINASNGYRAGTEEAIVAAVQTELTGSKSVTLHKRTLANGSAGGQWDLQILTLSSETLQNILPQRIIVPSSVRNWSVDSEPSGDIDRVRIRIANDENFYKDRALDFTAVPESSGIGSEPASVGDGFGLDDFGIEDFGADDDGVGPSEYHLYTPFYFPLDGSDPLTTMMDITYSSGTNSNLVVSAGIQLYSESGGIYTSLEEIVGSDEESISEGETIRLLGRSEGIPLATTYGRFLIVLKNVGPHCTVRMGHFGARKEINTEWIYRTADPVQAVLDRGAKPAGIKLNHSYLSSAWEDLENGGTTTWADLEALPDWAAVEEYDG